MTNRPAITPPPELVQQWREQAPRCRDAGIAREDWLMARAAQWGADQELEACIAWLKEMELVGEGDVSFLREDRRPKPQGPTDEELTLVYAYAVAAAVGNQRGPFNKEDLEAAQLAGLRAVLTRWGRPTSKENFND